MPESAPLAIRDTLKAFPLSTQINLEILNGAQSVRIVVVIA